MKRAETCLQLDAGNSGTKWRLLREGQVAARGIYRVEEIASREALLRCTAELRQIWVSSVAGSEAEQELSDMLCEQWSVTPWFARTVAECAGLRNSYAEPGRMGVDRWLAMLGAWHRIGGKACVVDVGSALTCDLISGDGQHEGGYIIPGPALMERALLMDTDRVRFAEDAAYQLTPGKSTAQAVRHGIALAQAGAMKLAIERAGISGGQLLFAGGGGKALMQWLDRGGRYLPDLVFEGLEIMAAQAP